MLRELRLDFKRYAPLRWYQLILYPAIWPLVWYRLGHWIYSETSHPRLAFPLKALHRFGSIFVEAFMQMRLDPTARVGGGLLLSHTGGIHLHPSVVIGENCDIAHHVTIGLSAMGRQGVPRIGNNVYIGTGATIVGKIIVGDGARIAANTLVMTSVPAGSTVMGVPGRIVMRAPILSVEQKQPHASNHSE